MLALCGFFGRRNLNLPLKQTLQYWTQDHWDNPIRQEKWQYVFDGQGVMTGRLIAPEKYKDISLEYY